MGTNNIQSDPMVLAQAANPISIGGRTFLIVKSVVWVGPMTAGDRATLTDSLGNVIFDSTCTTDKDNVERDFGANGQSYTSPLNLSRLDSGYLLVFRC
jgi:hypothetical protein